MNRVLFLMCIVVLLSSCNNGQYVVECNVGSTVNDDDTLYLESYDNVVISESRTDTAVVRDGRIVFVGEIDGSAIRRLNINGNIINFIVEPGNISIDFKKGLASGTSLNEQMAIYMSSLVDITDKYGREWDDISARTDISRDERSELLSQLMHNAHREEYLLAKEVVRNHKSDALGQWAFLQGIAGNECVTASMYYEELAQAGALIASYPPIKRETERLKAQEQTSVGAKYTDVVFGEISDSACVRLSDFIRGKQLYLVDVWTSSSEPCMRCRALLNQLYSKYAEKGLSVISVTLDKDKVSIENIIAECQFPVVVDSEMQLLDVYGVQNVPFLMLIDSDEKILARGISPSALEHWVRTELPEGE